jgi:hypothetical protein
MTLRKLVLTVVAAAACLAPTALADPPAIVPIPNTDFTDTTSCGFDVAIHYTMSNETLKIFSDGTVIASGPIKATFSANGKIVALNISGPAMIRGEAVTGLGVGAGPTLLPDGRVTLAYNAGQVDISGPAAVIQHGHMLLDICAALA